MAVNGKKTTLRTAHPRIVVGLPNLQDQLRMVDRQVASASDHELDRWADLGELLAELYSQLQQQKQVSVYRIGNRNKVKGRGDRIAAKA